MTNMGTNKTKHLDKIVEMNNRKAGKYSGKFFHIKRGDVHKGMQASKEYLSLGGTEYDVPP